MRIVEDISLKKGMTLDDLIHEFSKSGGFTSRYLSEAADIVEEMIRDRETRVFLSFPACIIATGTRGAITEMVKRKWVDVIITTCVALLITTLPEYGKITFTALSLPMIENCTDKISIE